MAAALDILARLRAALGDRYEVEREVGRGGMAHVFVAHDTKHGRRVAIKVLRPDLSAVLGTERFLREIQLAAQLQHPHILPLYDSGQADGLLYYLMPFVEGESLRERLDREVQLPVPEAVRIACDVAEALAYAHGQGVIHRDIKPENILLTGGQAVVADFGIARAVEAAGQDRLTGSGLAIGTPTYMSPEQAGDESTVDARADIYALGCVLFEMLAGTPPFSGRTPQAILARHQLEAPPSIRVVRPTVDTGIAAVIERALAKVPADRFASAVEFAQAFRAATPGPVPSRSVGRWLAGAVALGLVAAGLAWLPRGGSLARGGDADTTRYLVLPFVYDTLVTEPLDELIGLHDALGRWTGVSVVDPMESPVESPSSPERARALARHHRAGRYLWGSVNQRGDSVRVTAGLYDPSGVRLAEQTVRTGRGPVADSTMSDLVDRLLLGAEPGVAAGTRSLPAAQAFVRGQRAISQWHLAVAESLMAKATDFDPDFARAHLWLALARAWRGAAQAEWSLPAEQGVRRAGELSDRERTIATALLAQARGMPQRACPLWEDAVSLHPQDALVWYGLAFCLWWDVAVVPDARSPAGRRFRTSYWRALVAYQRAFALSPVILASFREQSYAPLRRLFMIAGNELRTGPGLPPDTQRYVATPEWRGDTLAFVPVPLAAADRMPSVSQADLRRRRLLFHNVALGWGTAFPESADALEALGLSYAMLGDARGLHTLYEARNRATDPASRIRMTASVLWLQLAFALPHDTARIRIARVLADSLLSAQPAGQTPDPLTMVGIAAVTGRAGVALAYAQDPVAATALVEHHALRDPVVRLMIAAALGGPRDSLYTFVRAADRAIIERLPPNEQPAARLAWIGRLATLLPDRTILEEMRPLVGQGDQLLDLQVAWHDGDTAAVLDGFRVLRARRRLVPAAIITMDALYPEAALLVAMGRDADAIEWLDPTLRALPDIAPHVMTSVTNSATLVRAMNLRARAGTRVHDDRAARAWAAAVVILWSDADAFLQSTVEALRTRAGGL